MLAASVQAVQMTKKVRMERGRCRTVNAAVKDGYEGAARAGLGIRAVVGLVVLVALLATPGSFAAATRRENEKWVALRVSPSGRVIVVQALGGGCGRDPRATAHETNSTVTITVTQAVPDDPLVACPAIARIDTLRVHLATPINGRALIGQSLRSATVAPTGRKTVPRMIGLRVADARFSLRAQQYEPRGARSGTVRRQRPGAGALVTAGPVAVTLSVTAVREPGSF